MKKVLVITCVLAILAMSAAMAAESKWALKMVGSDLVGTGYMADTATFGTGALGTVNAFSPSADSTNTAVAVGVVNPTDGLLYQKSSQANLSLFTMYVAANSDYASASGNSTFLLSLKTIGTSTVAPATVNGNAVNYVINVYNPAVAGGSLVNTWTLDGATTNFAASNATLWSTELAVKNGNNNWINNGYKVTVQQVAADAPVVPEPSSVLALGTGLMGLAGFVIRRRK